MIQSKMREISHSVAMRALLDITLYYSMNCLRIIQSQNKYTLPNNQICCLTHLFVIGILQFNFSENIKWRQIKIKPCIVIVIANIDRCIVLQCLE